MEVFEECEEGAGDLEGSFLSGGDYATAETIGFFTGTWERAGTARSIVVEICCIGSSLLIRIRFLIIFVHTIGSKNNRFAVSMKKPAIVSKIEPHHA